jgi:3-oxoacyl-(acyl-carrier-protein) synthase
VARTWVVSGSGLITAVGDTAAAVCASVRAAKSLATPDPVTGATVLPIAGFDATAYLQRKGVRDFSRTSQLACAAAAGNAKGLAGVPPGEIGVVFGSAWGALKTVVEFERQAHVQGPRFVDPILFTETVANVPAGQVAILNGWSAFNSTLSAGSASGLAALARAVDFLEEDRGRVAVAGGGDELDLPLLVSMRALSSSAPRGGVGEAACFLTVESEEHATARGAEPLARLRATACRFEDRGGERPGAVRESMEGLLGDLLGRVGIAAAEVDLVVLSTEGAAGFDVEETEAVERVFGGGPAAPSACAPKAVLGETWGASGPLAMVVAVETLKAGKIRNAVVVDRSRAGHQFAVVLSTMR